MNKSVFNGLVHFMGARYKKRSKCSFFIISFLLSC